MLLDSNIVIYSGESGYPMLADFFTQHADNLFASEISYVEVVGFHKLTEGDIAEFETFFLSIEFLPVSTEVIHRAARLRQVRKMSLGDSIIAATALCHDQPLATRNTVDFEWIEGLQICNPMDNA